MLVQPFIGPSGGKTSMTTQISSQKRHTHTRAPNLRKSGPKRSSLYTLPIMGDSLLAPHHPNRLDKGCHTQSCGGIPLTVRKIAMSGLPTQRHTQFPSGFLINVSPSGTRDCFILCRQTMTLNLCIWSVACFWMARPLIIPFIGLTTPKRNPVFLGF